MSRTDYATLTIVVLCIVALIALTYRVINLGKKQPSVPNTLVNQPPYTDPYAVDTLLSLDTLPTTRTVPIVPKDGGDTIIAGGEKTSPPPVTASPKATAPAAVAPAPSNTPAPANPTPKRRQRPKSAAGPYLVVAGTFRSETNAAERVKTLKKLGYAQARVGFFNQRTYASAIAGSYASAQAAQTVANAIQQQGIEAIVKKKQ